MRPIRLRTRAVALAVVAGAAGLAVAAPAVAHVEVAPEAAPAGTYPRLTFVVPNERDDSDTVALQVKLPAGHPFAYVAPRQDPGWTVSVDKVPLATPLQTELGPVTEAASVVTWTGGAVPPGQFAELSLEVGPLPDDASELVFPTVQTYADGKTVSWIDLTPASGEEPEQPAPVLRVVPAGTAEAATAAAAAPAEAAVPSSDRGLAIAAVIVAALALVAAVAAVVVAARRRPPG